MNNSFTDTYKKEISDILARIGEGIGKNVLQSIEPKIKNVSSELEQMRIATSRITESISLNEKFKIEIKNEIRKISDVVSNNNKSVESSYNKLKEEIKLIEKNKNNIVDTVKQIKTGMNESNNIVLQSLNNIAKSTQPIPLTIQKGNDAMDEFYLKNSTELQHISDSINITVLTEFDNISRNLQNHINNNKTQQKRIFLLIYFIIAILIIMIALSLNTIFKII